MLRVEYFFTICGISDFELRVAFFSLLKRKEKAGMAWKSKRKKSIVHLRENEYSSEMGRICFCNLISICVKNAESMMLA